MEQVLRMAKYVKVLETYESSKLSCIEAASLLAISERHFRRLRDGYREAGADYLLDKRKAKPSHRKAGIEEVESLVTLYREKHFGTNGRHFYDYLREDEGFNRSYTWVKEALQANNLMAKAKGKGKHRKKRDPKPMRGMMLFQDGSTHEWFTGQPQLDLIVTLDDATSEVYSMFFVAEEGTFSTLRGLFETIQAKGLFSSFYTDRGSHYFYTPEVGGKVDKHTLTQVGRALKQLSIQHIASYSPEARGRMERVFKTLQGRLPHDLVIAGIKDVNDANDWLKNTYIARHNANFSRKPFEEQDVFVPFIGDLNEVLCAEETRIVKNDNSVSYKRLTLQIPQDKHRYHYVKCEVKLREYLDKSLSIVHGQRILARFDRFGDLINEQEAVKIAA
jgi:hypothetical protein